MPLELHYLNITPFTLDNPAEVMGIYRLWLDCNVNTPPGWTLEFAAFYCSLFFQGVHDDEQDTRGKNRKALAMWKEFIADCCLYVLVLVWNCYYCFVFLPLGVIRTTLELYIDIML